MTEPQLVDYIKKAREAGQTDEQTRNLLYKNGWTTAEVGEAFASLDQPAQSTPSPAQAPSQPKESVQPTQPKQAEKPAPQFISPSISSAPSERKSHMGAQLVKVLAIIIVVVVLLGTGYFIAAQYFDVLWNPFGPSPEKVLDRMFKNMADVKSYIMSARAEIGAKGGAIININNAKDLTSPENPETSFTAELDANILNVGVFSAILDTRTFRDVLYVRFGNLSVPVSNGFDKNLFGPENIWLKLDADSVKVLSEAGLADLYNLELEKKIQDILASEKIMAFEKELSEEVINNQKTYHYLVKISKDKLKNLFTKILSLQTQEQESANLIVSNFAEAAVGIFTDVLGDLEVELWIGKKDYLLYKFKLNKELNLAQILPGEDIWNINIGADYSGFNQPISIEEPTEFQKIEDYILPVLREQKIKADMAQIGQIGQNAYNTNNSYYSLCNRGLLNGYLEEYGDKLIELNNDIINQGAEKPVCFGGLQGFCVSTQLPDNTYICVDELGIPGATKCVASTTICK